MYRIGDPQIDPSMYGPLGLKHIQAAGKAFLDAADTKEEYRSVLKPQVRNDSVQLSAQAQALLE